MTAYAIKTLGVPVELGLLAGVMSALILGVVFGLVAIRRQGVAFAMVTLALSQMVYFYAVQAPWMGGEDGIQSIPRGYLFGMFNLNRPFVLYYFVLAVTLTGFAAIYRAVHSSFGRAPGAIFRTSHAPPRSVSRPTTSSSSHSSCRHRFPGSLARSMSWCSKLRLWPGSRGMSPARSS